MFNLDEIIDPTRHPYVPEVPAAFALEQQNDPELRGIFQRLASSAYLNRAAQKALLSYRIVHSVLYRQESELSPITLVIPNSRKAKILQQYHYRSTVDHMDAIQMYDEITMRFSWSELYSDTRKYVRTCRVCRTAAKEPETSVSTHGQREVSDQSGVREQVLLTQPADSRLALPGASRVNVVSVRAPRDSSEKRWRYSLEMDHTPNQGETKKTKTAETAEIFAHRRLTVCHPGQYPKRMLQHRERHSIIPIVNEQTIHICRRN